MADNKLPPFVAGQVPSLIEAKLANIVRRVVNALAEPKVSPDGTGTITVEENALILNLSPLTERIKAAEGRLTTIEGSPEGGDGSGTPGYITPANFNTYFDARMAGYSMTVTCNEDGTFTITFNPPEEGGE